MDAGWASIVVAIVTTVGVIGGAYIAGLRNKSSTLTASPNETKLKELLDIKDVESDLWKEKYEEEIATGARQKAIYERKLEYLQLEIDECERKLSNVYSQLRAGGKIEDRRQLPRGEESE